MDVIELTEALVKIPSPSEKERKVGEFIFNYLSKNFKVKKQFIDRERFNIITTVGKPKILLCTHMDTIPEQIPVKKNNKFIYGRGSCDAKGALAAMIIAAEKLKKQAVKNFGLLIDVGEEDDFVGVKKIVKFLNPDLVIIGEPTNFSLITGQKGLLGFKIKCKGKAAHGATPDKGESAIEKLIESIQIINKMPLGKDKLFGKTKINVGKISGGSGINVVPKFAEAYVEIRTVPKDESIINIIRKKLKGLAKVELLYNFKSKLLDEKLINNLKINFNELIITPLFTEMYFWKNAIVIGPGNPELAHTKKEKISVKDLRKAVQIYFELVKSYRK